MVQVYLSIILSQGVFQGDSNHNHILSLHHGLPCGLLPQNRPNENPRGIAEVVSRSTDCYGFCIYVLLGQFEGLYNVHWKRRDAQVQH